MIAKKSVRPKKIILVFPKICELRERSSPLWQIYLFNRFFLAIFFSSLDSFVFLGSSFFAVCSLLLTLKIYILIQIQICRRVSDKKKFIRPISRNKTAFFGLQWSVFVFDKEFIGSAGIKLVGSLFTATLLVVTMSNFEIVRSKISTWKY